MDDLNSSRARRSTPPVVQQHGAAGSLGRFWKGSYAADYLGLATLLVVYILLVMFVEPFHRMFSLDDRRISFPHAEVERVPPSLLLLYAGVVPLVFLAVWAAIWRPGSHKVHVTYLGLITSVFVTAFLTEIIKNVVGRPRPDLLSRCKAPADTPQHILVTYKVCTETDHHTLQDGWRSFPSGHSSFAFSGLGFISLFLAAQLHALRPGTPLPAALFALLPVLGALLIAISRVEDYRHDVWDVTAGGLLGALIALAAYRRVYPSLWAPRCETPYPHKMDLVRRAARKPDLENGGAQGAAEFESEDEVEGRLLAER